ncbi:MAG: GGDEF domain-containing protein [Desulfarculaceae bacterium]|nr:GGDEF domain-containing protein [Desulfarculaceae bacterium]MCF8071957.1 GGDEF domain-containing protein [Desulfarculaceae bacterium]MCF8101474.1 GGDEF domain-containing protein [Desulfarculaceae bacterium]MCF8115024.1 GGDEF domain-containing protein [Desulfarculaceae bacterium]
MPFARFDDPQQALRLKRNLLALAAGAVLSILWWILWQWNFFRATPREFISLLGVFWLINLAWPLIIITGVNRRFRDPSMTLAQMAWATISVMVSLYFIYDMRMVVLMFYLLVIIFGAYHLRLAGFLFISGMAITGYGLVIYFLSRSHGEILNLRVEYVQWLTFSVVMTCFALVGAHLSALRRSHHLQNKQLAEALDKINELAVTDELTGVWNRRRMMQALEQHRALAERTGQNFVVCFIDLDHFKLVNDRYGHHVGDVVLRTVARVLRAELREIDDFARFGGEEFVAVLAQTTLGSGRMVAERLRRRVQNIDFHESAPELEVTVSVGLASNLPGETVDDLLRRADQAQYRAKTQGRNQVVLDQTEN